MMVVTDTLLMKRVTYDELKNGSYEISGDDYGIISDYFIRPTKDALLTNPNYDGSKTAVNLFYLNGKIVGRRIFMQTRIKTGEGFMLAQTGGGLEIHENFQGKGLGTMLLQDSVLNREYPIHIGQLYSSGAISIFRKMDVTIFEKPLYYKLCRSRSVLSAKGFKGFSLSFLAFFGDIFLKIRNFPNLMKIRGLKKRFTIKKESSIPEWVNDITLNDGHKYTEIHDQKWLQWNLDHMFSANPKDKNCFYAVYDKNGFPKGFYMTKERFEENKKGIFKNLIRGTVVEWGSVNESELSEAELNLLALATFSPDVDKINTVISGEGVGKDIESIGFSYRGMYQMTFKADEDCDSDMTEQNKWRIRYGGCDTILV